MVKGGVRGELVDLAYGCASIPRPNHLPRFRDPSRQRNMKQSHGMRAKRTAIVIISGIMVSFGNDRGNDRHGRREAALTVRASLPCMAELAGTLDVK